MFSQATITSVAPPVQHGVELLLSWTSTSPAGTYFQAYVDGSLTWYGTATRATIPLPPVGATARIVIGTIDVPPDSPTTSFASSLPAAPRRTTTLAWLGGTFEGADLAGFHVYGEASPGGGIDYGTILATIPAYTAGIVTDGYGYGGYGQGGYGESAGSYSWTSSALHSGTWHWAVRPFDTAGNEGPASLASDVIAVPPCEVPPGVGGLRLTYLYSPSTHDVTLNWLASLC